MNINSQIDCSISTALNYFMIFSFFICSLPNDSFLLKCVLKTSLKGRRSDDDKSDISICVVQVIEKWWWWWLIMSWLSLKWPLMQQWSFFFRKDSSSSCLEPFPIHQRGFQSGVTHLLTPPFNCFSLLIIILMGQLKDIITTRWDLVSFLSISLQSRLFSSRSLSTPAYSQCSPCCWAWWCGMAEPSEVRVSSIECLFFVDWCDPTGLCYLGLSYEGWLDVCGSYCEPYVGMLLTYYGL